MRSVAVVALLALAAAGCAGAPASPSPSPTAAAAATPAPTSTPEPTTAGIEAPGDWLAAVCRSREILDENPSPERDAIDEAFTLLDNVAWSPGETIRAELRTTFEHLSDAELARSFDQATMEIDAMFEALKSLTAHSDAADDLFGSAEAMCVGEASSSLTP